MEKKNVHCVIVNRLPKENYYILILIIITVMHNIYYFFFKIINYLKFKLVLQ